MKTTKRTLLFGMAIGLCLTAGHPALSQDKPVYVPPISSEFAYEHKAIAVKDSTMAYVDVGEGKPIVLLHGNPTSSYLWRNIIPFLEKRGRVIVPDLIGMGQSGKPDIAYTFADHSAYLDAFLEALDLTDIAFVLHDWGSGLGFDFASRNEDRVRGIAFMEAILPPVFPMESIEAMGPYADLFRMLRDPEAGSAFALGQNGFVEQILPAAVMRSMSVAEMEAYRAPFATEASRKPTLVWPNQIPIAGEPADVVERVKAYGAWLAQTDLPKLHLYASPGALNPPAVAEHLAESLKNIESIFVGGGIHYIQEDEPEIIGRAVADWLRRLD